MDFDIGSWFDSFSFEDLGQAAQVAGVATSAIGAYYSTSGQASAINAQAGLDDIQARSNYSASLAQIGLESINAQLGFAQIKHDADLSVIRSQSDAATLRAQAGIGMARAGASAANAYAGAAIDDNEAHLAELHAQSSLLHGQWDEQAVRMKTAQTKSKRRASMAARGIELGSGTTAAVLTSDEVVGEQSVTQVREKALQAALGYRMAAENAGISAGAKRASAGATLMIAGMEQQLSEVRATSLTESAIAEADFKKAMADAGMLNTEAALELKKVLAESGLSMSEAASDSKRTAADNMSPWLSAGTSLLGGVSKVADSWYRLNKTRG